MSINAYNFSAHFQHAIFSVLLFVYLSHTHSYTFYLKSEVYVFHFFKKTLNHTLFSSYVNFKKISFLKINVITK